MHRTEAADPLARAKKRVDVRRRIEELLAELPAEEREYVLSDILMSSAPAPVAQPVVANPAGVSERESLPTSAEQASSSEHEQSSDEVLGARGRTAVMLEFLRRFPRAGSEEIARAVYQDDDPTSRGKVRSLIFNAKQAGRLKKARNGSWEVLEG